MAKVIRWRGQFADIEKTQYTVEIYGEDNGSGVKTITLGANPLITEEDDSNDLFTPIRTQTGTLEVLDHDGTLMEEMLPADNLDHPVRVKRGNEIVWQGFMSCEAYSQDYTSREQVVEFNLIDVLEALKYIEINWTYGLETIKRCLGMCLDALITNGATFNYVYYPKLSYEILTRKIDKSSFFTLKDIANGNQVYSEAVGLDMYTILQRICTYMGWCASGSGVDIYFRHMADNNGYYRQGATTFIHTDGVSASTVYHETSKEIGSIDYRGIGHTKSISNGARSVEVVANVDKYDVKVSIPQPNTTYSISKAYHLTDGKYLYFLGCNIREASNLVNFNYSYINAKIYHDEINRYVMSNLSACYNNSIIALGTSSSRYRAAANQGTAYDIHAGAFFARAMLTDAQTSSPEYKNGIYCCLYPLVLNGTFDTSQVLPIVIMHGIVPTRINGGYLKLDASYFALYAVWSSVSGGIYSLQTVDYMAFSVKVGDKYWNDSTKQWTTTESIFKVTMDGGKVRKNWDSSMKVADTDGLLIPVNEELSGEVQLMLWPQADNLGSDAHITVQHPTTSLNEVFFDDLSLSYIPYEDGRLANRNQNNYYIRLKDYRFHDEIVVNTAIATRFSNNPSPSIIMENETTPMDSLPYHGSQVYNNKPEMELLTRLRSHYITPKRTLTLETSPLSTPLPITCITDRLRRYTPVAESRDWLLNKSAIKVIEI